MILGQSRTRKKGTSECVPRSVLEAAGPTRLSHRRGRWVVALHGTNGVKCVITHKWSCFARDVRTLIQAGYPTSFPPTCCGNFTLFDILVSFFGCVSGRRLRESLGPSELGDMSRATTCRENTNEVSRWTLHASPCFSFSKKVKYVLSMSLRYGPCSNPERTHPNPRKKNVLGRIWVDELCVHVTVNA